MKKILSFTLFLMSIFLSSAVLSAGLPASEYDVYNAKIYSIGDIHGDLQALKKALRSLGLYSELNRDWSGGNSHLVFTGDLVDRGPESKEVMDFIIDLETQAKEAGGHVHTLLGNHEILVTAGISKYAHKNDFNSFGKNLQDFKSDSKYAKWIRSRNSIIRINETLFVHAGLESWALNYSLDEINVMINDWVRYYQRVGPLPPKETKWITESRGPLWTRLYMESETYSFLSPKEIEKKDRAKRTELDKILIHFKASRIAVGHSIVESLSASLNHPVYGNKVMMTDTGISMAYGIIVSAFQYSDDRVTGYEFSRFSGKIIDKAQSLPLQKNVLRCSHVYN